MFLYRIQVNHVRLLLLMITSCVVVLTILILFLTARQDSSHTFNENYTSSPCRIPFPQLLDQIAQILTFVYMEVFCGNEEV